MPKNTRQNDDEKKAKRIIKRIKSEMDDSSSYDEEEKTKKKKPQTSEGEYWQRQYHEQLAITNSLKSQLEFSKTPDQEKLEKDQIDCAEKTLEAEILKRTYLSLIKAQNSKMEVCIEKNKQILTNNLSVYINYSREQLFNLVGSLLTHNINFMEQQYQTSQMQTLHAAKCDELRTKLHETELKLAHNEALLNAYNQISLGVEAEVSAPTPEITQPIPPVDKDAYLRNIIWVKNDIDLSRNNNNNQSSFSNENKSDEMRYYYPGK